MGHGPKPRLFEKKKRKKDKARTAVQTRKNQKVMAASKPKAKKAREAEDMKKA